MNFHTIIHHSEDFFSLYLKPCRFYAVLHVDFVIKIIKTKPGTNIGDSAMGMAASQARYLALTARKTNTEWEGQQIALATGTYTLKASSAGFDGATSGFDKPYYAGSAEITIEKDKEVNQTITCTLANVKVTVNFDQSFIDAFTAANVEIDDNADIRTYIASILGETYSIIEAANGTEGIRKAMKYVPDIIICDVMMPGIDGIECCKRLKQEIQTCHIPIMLLTACSLDEQRIQGYACGADSYIAKPFSSELLRARVANLILSRSRLKQYFGDNSALVKEDICDIDKDFVTQFKNLVEKHISNSDLSVEEIGREMGMSRVQLYRKLKSLTNYSPNELIRITRLKKAHSIISSQDKSISEVAYEVGFTSPSYFAKCYKDYFGESPTAIRSRPTKN